VGRERRRGKMRGELDKYLGYDTLNLHENQGNRI